MNPVVENGITGKNIKIIEIYETEFININNKNGRALLEQCHFSLQGESARITTPVKYLSDFTGREVVMLLLTNKMDFLI